MDRAAIHTYIGELTNDPAHDRYTTAIINSEMDAVQHRWNLAADILKTTQTLTVVSGTNSYTFGATTTYPIKVGRVTHKGLELKKRDKAWYDLYASDDWSDDVGTPAGYYFDDSATLGTLKLYPIPQGDDAGANLVVEFVYPHTAMDEDTDYPWNSANSMIPYHHGFSKEVAGNLLARDPSPENTKRAATLLSDASRVLQDAVNYFSSLSMEEPLRFKGGRYWNY